MSITGTIEDGGDPSGAVIAAGGAVIALAAALPKLLLILLIPLAVVPFGVRGGRPLGPVMPPDERCVVAPFMGVQRIRWLSAFARRTIGRV